MSMVNKFAGECGCGRRVAPRAGTLHKTECGGWYVCCAKCGPGLPAPLKERSTVDRFDMDYEDRMAERIYSAGYNYACGYHD